MLQSNPQQPTSFPAQCMKEISQRMLEGWKLLAQICPLCTTPLIQSRDGLTYCVGCRVHVLKEGESLPPPSPNAGATAAALASALKGR